MATTTKPLEAQVPALDSKIETRELDERIEKALRSLDLAEQEKELLRILSLHRGAVNAIKSAAIAEQAGLARERHSPEWRGESGDSRSQGTAENSRRWIAAAVETLVLLHSIPIGGLRVAPYGYFLIETRTDLDLAIGARWGEIYAHLRYLRALTSKQDVARLFGQQMLKLDAEEHA